LQRQILGILWYEFVTNVEVATLSQLPSINEARNRRRHSLATAGVWIRLLLPTKPYISQSRHDRAQDSVDMEETTRSSAKMLVEQVTTSTGLSPSDA